jgi:nucleoside permease NupC
MFAYVCVFHFQLCSLSNVMDEQYYEYTRDTEVIGAWKEGMCKGFTVGMLVGGTIIAFIGLGVCPSV